MRGRGSIVTRKLKDGSKSYAAVVRINGRQRWRWFRKQKDAARHLTAVVADVYGGTYREVRPVTFKTFATTWLESLTYLKASTVRAHRSTLAATLIPTFGDRQLEEITPPVVNEFLARQAERGLKPKTATNQLMLLTKILNDAREANHLAVNRIAGAKSVRRPRAVKAEDERVVEVFDPSELNKLLDAMAPHYHPFTLTWVSTGMRPGEITGLRWGDVDEMRRQIHVRRTFDSRERADLVAKTRGSRRSIDAGAQVLGALGALRRERFGDGPVDLEAPVFLTPDGGRVDVDGFRKRPWSRALAKAGLSYRKPYALRHSFISAMLAQGQSIKYVADQAGHTSAVMTLNVYAHYLPKERREAPALFEATLAAAREASPLTAR